MKTVLPPHERETVINFSRSEEDAYVFTYERRWISHFEKLKVKPHLKNAYGGYEYKVPKSWVRIPLPPRNRAKKEAASFLED